MYHQNFEIITTNTAIKIYANNRINDTITVKIKTYIYIYIYYIYLSIYLSIFLSLSLSLYIYIYIYIYIKTFKPWKHLEALKGTLEVIKYVPNLEITKVVIVHLMLLIVIIKEIQEFY